jgi:hypothetical protein
MPKQISLQIEQRFVFVGIPCVNSRIDVLNFLSVIDRARLKRRCLNCFPTHKILTLGVFHKHPGAFKPACWNNSFFSKQKSLTITFWSASLIPNFIVVCRRFISAVIIWMFKIEFSQCADYRFTAVIRI